MPQYRQVTLRKPSLSFQRYPPASVTRGQFLEHVHDGVRMQRLTSMRAFLITPGNPCTCPSLTRRQLLQAVHGGVVVPHALGQVPVSQYMARASPSPVASSLRLSMMPASVALSKALVASSGGGAAGPGQELGSPRRARMDECYVSPTQARRLRTTNRT